MLTPEGAAAVLTDLAARAVSIRVSNGQESATTEVTNSYVIENELVVGGEFGPEVANFEWRERAVLDKDGTVLDLESGDFGRKAAGAIWTAEAVIEIPAAS